jgi:hypothetical protein
METAILISAIICLTLAVLEITYLKRRLSNAESKLEEVIKAYNKRNRVF